MALTESEARTRLASMLQPDQEPPLTTPELDDLIRQARIRDELGNPPDAYPYRRAQYAYAVGAKAVPNVRNGHVYEVSATAGDAKTGGGEPAWPLAAGATVTDGNVTWREAGLAPWLGRWNLRIAARAGWTLKAAKAVTHKFGATSGVGDSDDERQRIQDACLKMADRYGRVLTSVRVGAE